MFDIPWGTVVTDVFVIVFPVLLAWALAEIHRMVPTLLQKWNTTFTYEQRSNIETIVRTGIVMAEQLASRPDIHDLATSKKELAFNFIDKAFAERGISLSAETISGEIEAAVYDEFNRKKPAIEIAYPVMSGSTAGTLASIPMMSVPATTIVPVDAVTVQAVP